jgi:hypothetical protein
VISSHPAEGELRYSGPPVFAIIATTATPVQAAALANRPREVSCRRWLIWRWTPTAQQYVLPPMHLSRAMPLPRWPRRINLQRDRRWYCTF